MSRLRAGPRVKKAAKGTTGYRITASLVQSRETTPCTSAARTISKPMARGRDLGWVSRVSSKRSTNSSNARNPIIAHRRGFGNCSPQGLTKLV